MTPSNNSTNIQQNNQEKRPLPKLQFATQPRRIIPVIIGGLGLFLIVSGIFINYIKTRTNTSESISPSSEPESDANVKGVEIQEKTILVDVSGAVVNPGLVEIPTSARVQDALIAAGGLSDKADRGFLAKNINLAQKISDGSKLYIPFLGESSIPPTRVTSGSLAPGKININTAGPQELDTLPGIGPVTAEKIITSRPYQDISELVKKRVLSASVFEKIKNQISLY